MKINRLLTLGFIAVMGMGGLTACNTKSEEITPVDDVDVVAQAKINLTDEEFRAVMTKNPVATTPTFFQHGVARMLMPGETDFFVNCIDGDTTHFTDSVGKYTIKVRYLGVDTRESTSEVEKWGKTTSNWAKTILDMNKETSKAKCVIVQSLESLQGTYDGNKLLNHYALPERDGYGRYLGIVWYTENAPFDASGNLQITKDDFRCMNLEIVYNGYSTANDTSKLGYLGDYFIQAENIARYKEIGIFSPEGTKDKNYYEGQAETLTLKELYESEVDGKSGSSPYADSYTRWKVTGVITAVNGGAFYIQEDYEDTNEHYGLYVFTNRVYDIVSVGNKVSVIGLISVYSGNYQMFGVSYHREKLNDWEMELIERGVEVNPIPVTYEEYSTGKYPQCFVKIEGSATCFDRTNTYGSYAFGGSTEIDQYNEKYKFYNTSNKIVGFAHHSTWQSGDGVNKKLVRLEIPDDVIINDDFNFSTVTSYKFLIGGTNKIYEKRPEDIYADEEGKAKHDVTKIKYLKGSCIVEGDDDFDEAGVDTVVHKAKVVDNLIGIMNYYVPVSGNENNSMWSLLMSEPREYVFSEVE